MIMAFMVTIDGAKPSSPAKPTRQVGRKAVAPAAETGRGVAETAPPTEEVSKGVVAQAAVEAAVKPRRIKIDNVYMFGGVVIEKPTRRQLQSQNTVSSRIEDYGICARQNVTLAR
jgi:hypothetical protein